MLRHSPRIALVLVLLGVSRGSDASFIVYTASLSGPAESPPNASPGVGSAEIDFDTTANTLRVRVTFSGLLGTTTASHIHAATPIPGSGTAIVATTTPSFAGFPLGVTSGTYDSGLLDLTSASSYNPAFITANGGTTASAEAALIAGAAAGEDYLNIHTSTVPGGEIRGFLTPVPEPASVVTLGIGALGFIAYAWRAALRVQA
jgi:CHRD domain-containing protein/PEP-CTERM motif-containing protein